MSRNCNRHLHDPQTHEWNSPHPYQHSVWSAGAPFRCSRQNQAAEKRVLPPSLVSCSCVEEVDGHSSMLRSCSRAAGRCVAVASRTPSLGRRPAAATVAAAGVRLGNTALPASYELSVVARRALSTLLSDEQLRRKMDEFNDLFVTVSTCQEALQRLCLQQIVSLRDRRFKHAAGNVHKISHTPGRCSKTLLHDEQ